MIGYHFRTKGFLGLCLMVLGLSLLALGTPARAGNESDKKVEICHFPPGKSSNYHTITISANALADHLKHGDFPGPLCE